VVEIPVGTPLDEVERRIILHTLDFTGGHRSQTADILKIGRKTLYRKLHRYGYYKLHKPRRGGRPRAHKPTDSPTPSA
jgi:DNA-binding NtrC family response regulator